MEGEAKPVASVSPNGAPSGSVAAAAIGSSHQVVMDVSRNVLGLEEENKNLRERIKTLEGQMTTLVESDKKLHPALAKLQETVDSLTKYKENSEVEGLGYNEKLKQVERRALEAAKSQTKESFKELKEGLLVEWNDMLKSRNARGQHVERQLVDFINTLNDRLNRTEASTLRLVEWIMKAATDLTNGITNDRGALNRDVRTTMAGTPYVWAPLVLSRDPPPPSVALQPTIPALFQAGQGSKGPR